MSRLRAARELAHADALTLTHRSRGVHQRRPVELREEPPQEVEVGLRLADDELDIGEDEREVVLVAVFCRQPPSWVR